MRCILLAPLAWLTAMGMHAAPVAPLADLPAPARLAVERQAGGRQILAVTTRAGGADDVVYEVLIAGSGEDVVLAVDPRGQLVGRFLIPRAAGLDGR